MYNSINSFVIDLHVEVLLLEDLPDDFLLVVEARLEVCHVELEQVQGVGAGLAQQLCVPEQIFQKRVFEKKNANFFFSNFSKENFH